MPIRTHRGRAAVYRRLWGWPLRSPKHLVGAVILAAVVLTAVGFVLPSPPPPERNTSSSERAAAAQARAHHDSPPLAAPTSTAAPPSVSVPNTPPPPEPADPAGVALVNQWGRLWADHPPGADRQQWAARLQPFTSEEFQPLMRSVDPANVPASAITGPATPVRSTSGSMDVKLPTNAGDLTVQLIREPAGWRVAGYDEVG